MEDKDIANVPNGDMKYDPVPGGESALSEVTGDMSNPPRGVSRLKGKLFKLLGKLLSSLKFFIFIGKLLSSLKFFIFIGKLLSGLLLVFIFVAISPNIIEFVGVSAEIQGDINVDVSPSFISIFDIPNGLLQWKIFITERRQQQVPRIVIPPQDNKELIAALKDSIKPTIKLSDITDIWTKIHETRDQIREVNSKLDESRKSGNTSSVTANSHAQKNLIRIPIIAKDSRFPKLALVYNPLDEDVVINTPISLKNEKDDYNHRKYKGGIFILSKSIDVFAYNDKIDPQNYHIGCITIQVEELNFSKDSATYQHTPASQISTLQ